ncbi:MAG: creatininase family protein [Burkholderiaceae bacterium]
MRTVFMLLMVWFASFSAPAGSTPASLFIEDLTWVEVRDAVRAGKTTVLIPVGGTEQNGPHMALGKHNTRVKALAGKIAASLGDALVAPVVAYVPEGGIAPPTGHMRFAGTISVPDGAFRGILDAAARSLKQHGFLDIVLIGDHGGYQSQLSAVATGLKRDWAATPARAHYIADYYQAMAIDYPQLLRAKGLSDMQVGTHAGAADTSLMLAIDSTLVRPDQMPDDPRSGPANGVTGDPRKSSAALGQLGVDLIVTKTAAAIRRALARPK